MSQGKFKNFLIKTKEFLTRFPVLITTAILLPCLIYTGRYIFSLETIYSNLFYYGEQMNANGEHFKLKKITPLFKVLDISTYKNYQGGACYQNYYAVVGNNFECLVIYDMDNNHRVEHAIFTNQTNTSHHCNTMFFGSDFYSASDKFPLLYISQENAAIPCTIAYRIHDKGGVWVLDQIQQINLTFDGGHIYYPNSYYDHTSGILFYGGYTKNSYMKSDDNYIQYFAFPMPDYRISRVELDTSKAINTFQIPSETATQGGFMSNGYLYQSFSGLSEAAPPFNKEGQYPELLIIDMINEQDVIYKIDDLRAYGENGSANDEFENIALAMNGKIYAHGNTHMKIYEFEYELVNL